LSDAGLTEEDIAARHFVTPAIVKQRLRLASVSPKLHEVYAEDGMTLEQLMAFSVTAVVVGQWPSQGGHYPVVAYQVAFGLSLIFQAAALVWFAMPCIRTFGRSAFGESPGRLAGSSNSSIDGPILDACAGGDW
jgi:hypothetical protein